MAIAQTAITGVSGQSSYLTWMAADKPLMGYQVIPVSPTTAKWSMSAVQSGADNTDSDYPARRAYDGKPGLQARGDTGSTSANWYYHLDLGSEVAFDFVALINHDFHLNSLTDIICRVNDDGDTAGQVDICTFSVPSAGTRLINLDLGYSGQSNQQITSQYFELFVTSGSAFAGPSIGQLVLGKRVQLQRNPLRPYDATEDFNFFGSEETTRTQSGVATTYTYSKGGYNLNAPLLPDAGGDELAGLKAFYRGCNYGTRPFIWVPKPNSAAASFRMMKMNDPEMYLPRPEVGQNEFTLDAFEQGPESTYLEIES